MLLVFLGVFGGLVRRMGHFEAFEKCLDLCYCSTAVLGFDPIQSESAVHVRVHLVEKTLLILQRDGMRRI